MGTMESTQAHLYAARMKAFGGGWSVRGASDMARHRSCVFSGDSLPMPKVNQRLSKQDITRREKAWINIQSRIGFGAADVLESVGEGYEPPRVHIAGFSTQTPASALIGLLR